VCILEKGSEVGAHILSGAVIDPIALNELIPDWKGRGAPLTVPVTENHHWVLTKSGKWGIPELLTPPFMHNRGTYTLSLGNLCRWLAGQAEELGVEIFPGFPAAEILFNEDGTVTGVATGDMGIARDGSRRPDYQPGRELHASYTFFAEGGGGQLALGVVVALDYSDPYLWPFDGKQRWRTHPAVRAEIEGGRRVSYGARAIDEGGYQAIPNLAFPGGALIGCSAGFVNVPRIKGTHTAMKSAMLAAEAAFEAIANDRSGDVLDAYEANLRSSWVSKELKMVRNVQPAVAH